MKKILLTFLLSPLLGVGTLSAQTEAASDEALETVEPTTPQAQNDRTSDPSMDEKISVNFPDTSVAQILLNYERLTGKKLIKDMLLTGQNSSIVVAEPGKT